MNKSCLQYHFVFVTKYRKKVLSDEILKRIEEIIKFVAERHHFEFVKMGSENHDHIHLVLKLKPSQSVSLIVQLLKQYTQHYIWEEFAPILRKSYWGRNYLWSDGYFCSSMGNISSETVLQYIEKQIY